MRERLEVFFSYGFRPFFLFAAVHAVMAMAAWMAWIGIHFADGMVKELSIAWPPHIWHAHEMLFGFVGAAVAGFMLTAMPNWTGKAPLHGEPLVYLSAAWLAGRIAVWSSALLPAWLVAIVDGVFLPSLFVFAAIGLAGRMSKRNWIFLPMLASFALGNLLVHADRLGWLPGGAYIGHVLALDTVVLLIAVLGGRIVPAFTTNALRNRGDALLPKPFGLVDGIAVALTLAVLVTDAFQAPDVWRGALFAAAAIAHAVRLAGWRGLRTLDTPILWILHLGYLWLVAGFALRAIAMLTGAVNETAALHGLGLGAAASMIVGVMSRASLGHTGRSLVAPKPVVAAYLLVSLAAGLRIIGPTLAPAYYNQWILAAGAIWCAAFAIFTAVYWPILTQARARTAE